MDLVVAILANVDTNLRTLDPGDEYVSVFIRSIASPGAGGHESVLEPIANGGEWNRVVILIEHPSPEGDGCLKGGLNRRRHLPSILSIFEIDEKLQNPTRFRLLAGGNGLRRAGGVGGVPGIRKRVGAS